MPFAGNALNAGGVRAIGKTGTPYEDLHLRVTCASTRGIVAAISGALADADCNITDSAQFDDVETGRFFMRVSFRSEGAATLESLRAMFAPIATRFGMEVEVTDDAVKKKVLIMVSRFGHCLNDLLYRWRIGACRSRSWASCRTTTNTRRSS